MIFFPNPGSDTPPPRPHTSTEVGALTVPFAPASIYLPVALAIETTKLCYNALQGTKSKECQKCGKAQSPFLNFKKRKKFLSRLESELLNPQAVKLPIRLCHLWILRTVVIRRIRRRRRQVSRNYSFEPERRSKLIFSLFFLLDT